MLSRVLRESLAAEVSTTLGRVYSLGGIVNPAAPHVGFENLNNTGLPANTILYIGNVTTFVVDSIDKSQALQLEPGNQQ